MKVTANTHHFKYQHVDEQEGLETQARLEPRYSFIFGMFVYLSFLFFTKYLQLGYVYGTGTTRLPLSKMMK